MTECEKSEPHECDECGRQQCRNCGRCMNRVGTIHGKDVHLWKCPSLPCRISEVLPL